VHNETADRAADKCGLDIDPAAPFRLQCLTDEDCQKIHNATLEILDQSGIYVPSDKATAVFADSGARVNKQEKRVFLPPQIIEKAMSTIPSHIRIPGRERSRDYIMGGDTLGFINFGTTVFINDLATGERRKSLTKDVAQATRVLDALNSIEILITVLSCTEKSSLTETMHATAAMLANTTKPVEAVPPTANLIPNFVTSVLSMCLAGGTSPIHLAGTVVQHNAEVLSGLVLGQLLKPGAPMIYSSSTTSMDMLFGTAAVGSAEGALLNAALARMGRYYHIPVRVSGG